MRMQNPHRKREDVKRKMLNEICAYLKNYFEVDKLYGDFVIENGGISYADGKSIPVKSGAYIRVVGSTFNDGIYRVFDDTPIDFIQDESFNGSIWRLAIPNDVINLSDEIRAWRGKYERFDSTAMSPYTSESFNGYSYSKNPSDGSKANDWRGVYKNRLSRYRKI